MDQSEEREAQRGTLGWIFCSLFSVWISFTYNSFIRVYNRISQ